MKILVIDGQGGKIGKLIVDQIKQKHESIRVLAIGTNSLATAAMLKSGADEGATGENPVIWNSKDADIIIGPIGIIIANSLHGEISPAMAVAVSECKARKILIPINRCNNFVVGVSELPLSEYINLAVQEVHNIIEGSR